MSDRLWNLLKKEGRKITVEHQKVFPWDVPCTKPLYMMCAPQLEGDWDDVPMEDVMDLVRLCVLDAKEHLRKQGKEVL